MKRKIDENGFYIGDIVEVEQEGEDADDRAVETFCIDAPPPQGFYRPKWNGEIEEWEEGESPEERQARESELSVAPKTEIELLQEQLDTTNAAMAELMILVGGTL